MPLVLLKLMFRMIPTCSLLHDTKFSFPLDTRICKSTNKKSYWENNYNWGVIWLSKNTPDSPTWKKIMDPADKYFNAAYNKNIITCRTVCLFKIHLNGTDEKREKNQWNSFFSLCSNPQYLATKLFCKYLLWRTAWTLLGGSSQCETSPLNQNEAATSSCHCYEASCLSL